MKAPKEIIDGYQEIKGWGVLAEMMKKTKTKSHTHLSNIVHGKVDTTVSKLSSIKKFIESKKETTKKLTETDQN